MSRALPLLALLLAFAPRLDGTLWNRSYLSPADGSPRVYDVWTPSGYTSGSPRPAILFLHGRGGSKGSFQQTAHREAADARGVILIFWQGRWQPEIGALSTHYVDGRNGVPDETDVLACLADALTAFAVDPARVHLAGFSQGGKGALLIGLKNPDRFASVVAGASPTDAFQGQLWSPGFPDYAAAAGGPASAATGETLALWYAQSPRFFLPNARNLPILLLHGTADPVVPDSAALFPYRNTHHVADTPGFSDARGPTPTLAELRASDGGGYEFRTSYLSGVGHDQSAVVTPASLFGFVEGKSRPASPERVVARTYERGSKGFYWLTLARIAPADGSAAAATATRDGQALSLSAEGNPAVTISCAAAQVDAARPLAVTLAPGSALSLRLAGAFAPRLRVLANGVLLEAGSGYTRDGNDVLLTLDTAAEATTISVSPEEDVPIAGDDLLVPALVHADGLLGARFRTELVLANASPHAASLELLLAGATTSPVRLELPARATRLFRSETLFALLGLPGGAAPLRLRAVSGEPGRLFASSRVFNERAGGTYGLSFPVERADASVLAPGEEADLFGGAPAHPSRTNLSLFAPFESATVSVRVHDAAGTVVRALGVSLARLQRVQLDDLLASAGSPARVSVRVVSGRVQAYATVIENAATNDPFRSPPLLRSRAAAAWTVPAVASAPGRFGAVFTSDLHLHAPGDADVDVVVRFRPRGGGETREGRMLLAAGRTRVVEDVLGTLFPGAGALAGALDVACGAPVQLLAVTRSDSPSGPASQDLPAAAAGGEIRADRPALFVGLAESPRARSNLVLVNGEAPATLALELLAEDGPRGRLDIALAPGEVRQLDSVALLFGGAAIEAGALLVRPLSGGLAASAVRIDNVTNDPAGLTPLPASSLAAGIAGSPKGQQKEESR